MSGRLLFISLFVCPALFAQQENFHIRENKIRSVSGTITWYNFPYDSVTWIDYQWTDTYDRNGIRLYHTSIDYEPECDGGFDSASYNTQGKIIFDYQDGQVGSSRCIYKYDKQENLVLEKRKQYDWNGKYSGLEKTAYDYDEKGRVLKIVHGFYTKGEKPPDTTSFIYTFDRHDSLVHFEKISSAEGKYTTDYFRDTTGRVVFQKENNGKETWILYFEYDSTGNVVRKFNDGGYVWRYEYNSHGQLVKEVEFANGKMNGRIEYTYNAKGDLVEEDDYDGNGILSTSITYLVIYYG